MSEEVKDYLGCLLQIDDHRLLKMLEADQSKWENELSLAKIKAEQLKQEIEDLIKKQIESSKPRRRVYAPPSNPFMLKRLDLFGE